MKENGSPIVVYVYLAVGSVIVGIILVLLGLLACQSFGIDISRNWWILGIPVVLAVILNIALIELYDKFRKK